MADASTPLHDPANQASYTLSCIRARIRSLNAFTPLKALDKIRGMADLQPGGVNQGVCLAHTRSTATGDAFDLDPKAYIRKKWHNATNGRHYQADLYRDLFEAWILIRTWRGDRHRGNEKMAVVASYQEGMKQIKRVHSTRARRGYRLVD